MKNSSRPDFPLALMEALKKYLQDSPEGKVKELTDEQSSLIRVIIFNLIAIYYDCMEPVQKGCVKSYFINIVKDERAYFEDRCDLLIEDVGDVKDEDKLKQREKRRVEYFEDWLPMWPADSKDPAVWKDYINRCAAQGIIPYDGV